MKNKTLKDVIIEVFTSDNKQLTYHDCEIIWAMLANNEIYDKENADNRFKKNGKFRAEGDYSGSFRYNGGQVADAFKAMGGKIDGNDPFYDYMEFYCSEATMQEASEMRKLFRKHGYEVIFCPEHPQYIR